MTVGECWGATPEIARLYTAPERKELNMIFQFEQIQLDKQKGGQRWDLKELDLRELKAVFSKWQYELDGCGWNSLFWSNHDLPRIVSRWGNDGKYRELSAKMLATLLHGMKGTPYIYQGEELGMTNVPFTAIENFPDIETQNIYKERLRAGFSAEETIHAIRKKQEIMPELRCSGMQKKMLALQRVRRGIRLIRTIRKSMLRMKQPEKILFFPIIKN